jgi:hypothetical protein
MISGMTSLSTVVKIGVSPSLLRAFRFAHVQQTAIQGEMGWVVDAMRFLLGFSFGAF